MKPVMSDTEKIRERLQEKLAELFRLDRPDLDFGFYRIMHAKAEEVSRFIRTGLLKDVEETFGKIDDVKKSELKTRYEEVPRQAEGFGVSDPGTARIIEEDEPACESSGNGTAEAEVYDRLLRFFSRYYEAGDFISRRYYVREDADRAAPFAIPYNGEEVKLHWANADQYYVKSTESFSNYTFDLRRHGNLGKRKPPAENLPPLRVRFRIVDASEGEHGDIKTAKDNRRFFLLHERDPVFLDENGELVVNFEFRPDTKKTGRDGTWQERRNTETVAALRKLLKRIKGAEEYRSACFAPAPTDKNPRRTVLAEHLMRYTARNTTDYFIHKNLGDFLRRELDFYVKNEVMRLDDIDGADAPAIRSYFEKIKLIRKIAGKLIDFLAQAEDFQKKLWLKKKFVTDTNYCITLDRIPVEFYPEIAANKAQQAEWVELFAVDRIEKTPTSPGHARKPSIEFLEANDKLPLDTGHFDADFKARLLESIEDFDRQCDGLLVHSENFQALHLLQERYREQVKCVYIDPPYNTSASEILYKNEYKHSSWCTLLYDRISASVNLLSRQGVFQAAIDDAEFHRLESIVRMIFGDEHYIGNIAIMQNPKGRDQKHIADCHEYAILAARDIANVVTNRLPLPEAELLKKYPKIGPAGRYRELPLRRSGSEAQREDRPSMYFPFIYDRKNKTLSLVSREEYGKICSNGRFDDAFVEELRNRYAEKGFDFILPVRDDGSKGRWRWGYDSSRNGIESGVLFAKVRKNSISLFQSDKADETYLPKSLWYGDRYDASSKGTNVLSALVPRNPFDYPKSVHAVEDMLRIGADASSLVLDYFAGSGTTGHAVINLNREDGGRRKYVLVEMGDHFNTVLKPRMMKVIYGADWRAGKPRNRNSGISHCFKYVRLESYEDTLNNLRFDDGPAKTELLRNTPSLREDYMLHYMLEIETRGSQSLLNIDAFAEPEKYLLDVKKAGSGAYERKAVDLVETFNYLIGLRVERIRSPRRYDAGFKRTDDRRKNRLLDGPLVRVDDGKWMFRAVSGRVPKNSFTPNDGLEEKVLVVWRNLTGHLEEDNLVLNEWFRKYRADQHDFAYDIIYVNGGNNLSSIRQNDENWRVQLIEEEFFKRMWNVDILD